MAHERAKSASQRPGFPGLFFSQPPAVAKPQRGPPPHSLNVKASLMHSPSGWPVRHPHPAPAGLAPPLDHTGRGTSLTMCPPPQLFIFALCLIGVAVAIGFFF
jgi:hypothetical protein